MKFLHRTLKFHWKFHSKKYKIGFLVYVINDSFRCSLCKINYFSNSLFYLHWSTLFLKVHKCFLLRPTPTYIFTHVCLFDKLIFVIFRCLFVFFRNFYLMQINKFLLLFFCFCSVLIIYLLPFKLWFFLKKKTFSFYHLLIGAICCINLFFPRHSV